MIDINLFRKEKGRMH